MRPAPDSTAARRVPPPPARGFTLVELVVALAVAAVLVGLAVPSFRDLVAAQRRDAALGALAGDLRFARSEAIKRAARVGVCARAEAGATGCGTDWSRGWTVWIDGGPTPGTIEPAAGEAELRVRGPVAEGLALDVRARTASGMQAPTAFRAVRFGPRGTSSWRGGGTFRLCARDGAAGEAADDAAAAVNVSLSGDVRRAREDGSGAPIDAFGMPVSCAPAEAEAA